MEKKYRFSFEAKLSEAFEDVKDFYGIIKDQLLSYKKVHSRISFNADSFSVSRKKIVKIVAREKMLYVYYALDPNKYIDGKYKSYDVSSKKTHEDTPLLFKVRSNRTLAYALTLLEDLLALNNVSDKVKTQVITDYSQYSKKRLDEYLYLGWAKEVKSKKKVTKYPVTFNITLLDNALNYEVNDLYVVGNIEELGYWNPKNGVKLNLVNGIYTTTVMLEEGTNLEFKVVRMENWMGVEKGIFTEEIPNHSYVITKEVEIEDLVHNFRNN